MKPGTVLPDNFLRRMAVEDRPAGRAGMTTAEGQAKYAAGQENALQRDCANLLRQRDIWFRQMPYGKKTHWPGFPDFLIILDTGFCLLVEAKALTGVQSQEQIEFQDSLPKGIYNYHVIYNLTQLQDLLPTAPKGRWMTDETDPAHWLQSDRTNIAICGKMLFHANASVNGDDVCPKCSKLANQSKS